MKIFSHRFNYSYKTLISWLLVDDRCLACHCLWASYRWEKQ